MKKINFLLISFFICMYSQNATASSGCSFDEQPYNCWTNEGELLLFRTHFYYDPPAPERSICTWATDLPSGASYPIVSDYGEVYNDFIWIPTCGQAGFYTINFHSGEDCGVSLGTLSVDINVYSVDSDSDGIIDCDDNCPNHPNGLLQGTCTEAIGGNYVVSHGQYCTEDTDCDDGEYCEKFQADNYPQPNGNGIGDVCECEADFNCDRNVDGGDVGDFLDHFGRSQYFNPCTNEVPCQGDFNCDSNVDGGDVGKFLEDFGRSQFFNPCPACVAGDWCVY